MIFFVLLALVIISPLLSPGFILSFDIAAVPFSPAFPSFFSSTFLFGSLWTALSWIVSSAWLEKIWLFLIFFLAGWGMFRLTGKRNVLAGIFAGSLYAVNPFVYERVMVGHWGLLLGYSLLPWLVEAILNSRAILAAILLTFIISIDVHFALIFLPFFLVLPILRGLRWSGVFYGFTALLNLNWLVPFFLGRSDVGTAISSFSISDLVTFQSLPDHNFGLIFNLLSGYGLWTETSEVFILPKDVVFSWPVITLALLALGGAGVYYIFRTGSRKQIFFAGVLIAIAILALDFAGGVALPGFREAALYLYNTFPVLYGLREPQKVIGLLFFAYAFFGGAGVELLWEEFVGIKRQLIVGAVLILPFVYAPTIFGGFWGQLRPVSYPQSYFEVKKILDQDKGDFLVLAFPWHQYLRYRFNNDRPVANLAPLFFGPRVLVSRDSHNDRTEELQVSGLLRMETEGVNLLGEKVDFKPNWASGLAVINVKYILLSKDEDFEKYGFLNRVAQLGKIYEGDGLILYKLSSS